MAIAKAQPAKKAYNPYAYVPGGSSAAVSKAIQKAGYAKPAPVVRPKAPATPAPVVPDGYNDDFTTTPGSWSGAMRLPSGGVWNPGPNYGADLVGEPDFTEANARYEENVRLAHDQRRNRVRAALIKLGFQPGGADARALADIDPSTADLAANNSASVLAQLGLKRGTDRADLSAELASRGLLDSGALRGGENMVQSSYDQGILGGTQDYLNEQNTALGDEASTLATGQSAFTQAKALAAQAAARNPLFTPTYSGAQDYGDTLAPGQGTRPDQTPVLAPAPALARQPVKPPAKVVAKAPVKESPALRALRLRGEALNRQYGLGR